MTSPHQVRLAEVRALRYRMPLKRAYGTARGKTTAGVNFLVELNATRNGELVEGVGECQPRHKLTGDGGRNRADAWKFLCAATVQLEGRTLRCQDRHSAIAEVRTVMADMHTLARQHAEEQNRDKPFRGTLLGIEVALLDVVSRALGLQISELLGKQREDIEISISTISSSTALEDVPRKVARQKRFPMTRVKGIGEIDRDLQLLEVVSQANESAGAAKPLWMDINEALDYEGAARLVKDAVQQMAAGVLPPSLILEGILPKRDVIKLPALQRLADEESRVADTGQDLDVRIMPDEGFWDVSDLARLNAVGGCRAINIKAPKAGGLLASLDLARAAVDANPEVHICIGGMVGTSDITAWALHNLARALPRVDYLTTVPPGNVEERIAEPQARYAQRGSSVIESQTTPGLGTQLQRDKVAPFVQDTYQAAGPDRPAIQVSPPPRVSGQSATLTFTGDTSLGDVFVHQKGGNLLSRLEDEPMSYFEGVQPLITDQNALVINFESVLANAPTSPFEGRKKYLGWDDPDRSIACFRELGVDAVGLANNHTMDFGSQHLLETKARFEQSGIQTVGAGQSRAEAATPLTLSLTVAGVERRVHLIAGMSVRRQLRDEFQFYAGRTRPGVNALAIPRVSDTIKSLRRDDPASVIIAYPHWGRNYAWASPSMQRGAETLLNAGADLVLGHGAHMLQQCTFSAHGVVAYSLGNFVFNWAGRFGKMNAPPFGLVARLTLASGNNWPEATIRLYPIMVDNRITGHRCRPVNEEEFTSLLATLRKLDLDESFNRYAGVDTDDRGHHIAYSFEPRAALLGK